MLYSLRLLPTRSTVPNLPWSKIISRKLLFKSIYLSKSVSGRGGLMSVLDVQQGSQSSFLLRLTEEIYCGVGLPHLVWTPSYLRCSLDYPSWATHFFLLVFFSIWVLFHEHSRITELQGKGEDISLTPYYHFHRFHRQLDISRQLLQISHFCT